LSGKISLWDNKNSSINDKNGNWILKEKLNHLQVLNVLPKIEFSSKIFIFPLLNEIFEIKKSLSLNFKSGLTESFPSFSVHSHNCPLDFT